MKIIKQIEYQTLDFIITADLSIDGDELIVNAYEIKLDYILSENYPNRVDDIARMIMSMLEDGTHLQEKIYDEIIGENYAEYFYDEVIKGNFACQDAPPKPTVIRSSPREWQPPRLGEVNSGTETFFTLNSKG